MVSVANTIINNSMVVGHLWPVTSGPSAFTSVANKQKIKDKSCVEDDEMKTVFIEVRPFRY